MQGCCKVHVAFGGKKREVNGMLYRCHCRWRPPCKAFRRFMYLLYQSPGRNSTVNESNGHSFSSNECSTLQEQFKGLAQTKQTCQTLSPTTAWDDAERRFRQPDSAVFVIHHVAQVTS